MPMYGVNKKALLVHMLIETGIFHNKFHENSYQVLKVTCPCQVLQVTHAMLEHAMKLKVRKIKPFSLRQQAILE